MFHSAFKEDIEKVVLLEVKALIQIIVKFKAEKILCTFLSPSILLRGMKYRLQKQLCSFENERLISFSYKIWLMISEKNITRCTFLHRGVCMHQKSQQCIPKIISVLKITFMWTSGFNWYENYMDILTKGRRSFKNAWKKTMQLLWTTVTYLLKNDEHGIEHDIDSTYGDIRLSWNLHQIWWIPCNLSRCWIWQSVSLEYYKVFCYLFIWSQISYKSWRLQNTGKHWNKMRHWLLWKRLC